MKVIVGVDSKHAAMTASEINNDNNSSWEDLLWVVQYILNTWRKRLVLSLLLEVYSELVLLLTESPLSLNTDSSILMSTSTERERERDEILL